MGDELPKGPNGARLCDRCHGPIQQPPIGRRRLYCGRNCRELAYRERATADRVASAVEAALAAAAPESSVDETKRG